MFPRRTALKVYLFVIIFAVFASTAQARSLYVVSDTYASRLRAYEIAGDANITTAMSEADCNNYGWDDGWNWDPYIDPGGWVEFGGVSWNCVATGTVGYFKFRYNSGQVTAYIDQENSMAFGWDGESCPPVSFSTDALVFGGDLNEQ